MQHYRFLTLALLGLVILSGCGTPAASTTTSGAAVSAHTSTTGAAQAIVFVRGTTRYNTDLFVMDETGANIRQLTNTPELEGFPVWSPDGTLIAFGYAGQREPSEGWPLFQVYTMRPDGSERVQRTGTSGETTNDTYPTWSPDGTRIAYISFVEEGIWAIDVNGSAPQRLTPEDVGTTTNPHRSSFTPPGSLAWSPDGSSFLIGGPGGGGIFHITTDGTILKRLTEGALDHDPVWSPDGKQIAFVRHSGESNETPSEIFIMDADGSNLQQVTHTPGLDHTPTWSLDGTRIAFASAPGDVSYPPPTDTPDDIFVIKVDGTGLRNLTNSPAHEFDPTWKN